MVSEKNSGLSKKTSLNGINSKLCSNQTLKNNSEGLTSEKDVRTPAPEL